MSIADWILLAAIIGYCLYLILRPRKAKCSGCCQNCSGCTKR